MSPYPVDEVSGCPRCGGADRRVLFTSSDRLFATTTRVFSVVECSSCGLLRLDPWPRPNELAEFYPTTYWWDSENAVAGRLTEIYRRVVLLDHVRFAARSIEAPGPVLDIGCGGGAFAHALARRGFRVVGADFSAAAGRVCLRGRGVPAVNAALPALPFREGSFAAVTMFHVLEHLLDPAAAVDAAGALLAPGGRIIAQVPNAACWQMFLLGARWSGFDVPRHLIHFRAADLEELFRDRGFEVRRKKFFSLRDNPAGLATSLWPALEPVSRKVRRVEESRATELMKNLLYLAIAAAAVPWTLLEAVAGAGSTVMIEAARPGEPRGA